MKRAYQFPDTSKDNFGQPAATEDSAFDWLILFLNTTKAACFETGRIFDDGRWWVQFKLDLTHKHIWTVIQELTYVANNSAVFGKLPVKLIPWTGSPENGPPEKQLAWRIECYDGKFSPDDFVAQAGTHVAKRITPWPPKVKFK